MSGWLLGGPAIPGIGPGDDPRIYKVRPDGSEKTWLTQGVAFGPSWSADGKRIAYAAPGPDQVIRIWTMAADGSGQKMLPAMGVAPAFSPDGSAIVFQAAGGVSEVWWMTAQGTNLRPLTRTTGVATSRHGAVIQGSGAPSFAPDGAKILYTSSQSGQNELWTMAADGSNQTQLTFPTDALAPDANASRFSPDGRWIVFFGGYETEYGNVYVMDATGGNRVKVSSGRDIGDMGRSANCDSPAWAPDGRIVFQSDMALNGSGLIDPAVAVRTWIVGADGMGERVLLDYALNYGPQAWTP